MTINLEEYNLINCASSIRLKKSWMRLFLFLGSFIFTISVIFVREM